MSSEPTTFTSGIARCRDERGFSLVELAIVVLIVSILLTMGLAAFSVQVDTAALSATQKRQEAIKDALIAYLRKNRRLPCPETMGLAGGGTSPTGRENRANVSGPPDPSLQCSSYVGTLPWLDLGLPKDAALDGYGNFHTYFVSSAAAVLDPDWTLTANPGTTTGFGTGSPGRFAITHNGQTTGVDASLYPLPALAAVVLVSHGKNGFGAITEKGTRNVDSADASELANQPPVAAAAAQSWSPQVSSPIDYNAIGMRVPAVTATLVTGSTTAGGTFDDVVLVLRPDDLLVPIIKDGSMKSAEALVQEQLVNVRDAAIAEMLANNCTPKLSLATLLPTDPWGSTIFYTRVSSTPMTQTNQVILATTNAFRIWSFGPNRDDDSGAGDDKALQTGYITYGQFLSRISPTACPSS